MYIIGINKHTRMVKCLTKINNGSSEYLKGEKSTLWAMIKSFNTIMKNF
jgi:hypothetical protein